MARHPYLTLCATRSAVRLRRVWRFRPHLCRKPPSAWRAASCHLFQDVRHREWSPLLGPVTGPACAQHSAHPARRPNPPRRCRCPQDRTLCVECEGQILPAGRMSWPSSAACVGASSESARSVRRSGRPTGRSEDLSSSRGYSLGCHRVQASGGVPSVDRDAILAGRTRWCCSPLSSSSGRARRGLYSAGVGANSASGCRPDPRARRSNGGTVRSVRKADIDRPPTTTAPSPR
ncbi:hypothetical protein SAMN04488026_109015 [Aliiruegeria lutimaris]|uniref:Uncharacterized protein n=1 Tax=Aliiruegeria lutimaris TaxID=571298 RepID=A0A1G9KN29_9RHOB|nr:hypothetical protein SAMN04488026_109015 [Aliiruegeria lutimaris]